MIATKRTPRVSDEPLLPHDIRDLAEASVRELCETLPPWIADVRHSVRTGDGVRILNVLDPTLASGTAGVALFFAEAGNHFADEVSLDRARQYLGQSCSALGEFPIHPRAGLFQGLPGVALASHQLRSLGTGLDEESLDAVDAIILEQAGSWIPQHGYDLVSGLVGLGVYGLRRAASERGVAIVDAVLARLDELSVELGTGTGWLTTRAPGSPAAYSSRFGESYIDIGVAHGVAGVVAFVSRAHRAGIRHARSLAMLEGAVRLIQHSMTLTSGGGAPAAIDARAEQAFSNLPAWCYGSLGVSHALLSASQVLGCTRLRLAAIELAISGTEHLLGRPDADCSVCHGLAGQAHLANRLFESTGDPRLLDLARRSITSLLAARAPGKSLGGYRSRIPDPRGHEAPEMGLSPFWLLGSSGIGLVLLAALGARSISWDDALLLAER